MVGRKKYTCTENSTDMVWITSVNVYQNMVEVLLRHGAATLSWSKCTWIASESYSTVLKPPKGSDGFLILCFRLLITHIIYRKLPHFVLEAAFCVSCWIRMFPLTNHYQSWSRLVIERTNTLAFQLRTRVDLSLKEKGNLSMCRIRIGLTNQRWKGVITVLVQTVLWSPQQHSIWLSSVCILLPLPFFDSDTISCREAPTTFAFK